MKKMEPRMGDVIIKFSAATSVPLFSAEGLLDKDGA
jgi:hypothetical protein